MSVKANTLISGSLEDVVQIDTFDILCCFRFVRTQKSGNGLLAEVLWAVKRVASKVLVLLAAAKLADLENGMVHEQGQSVALRPRKLNIGMIPVMRMMMLSHPAKLQPSQLDLIRFFIIF